VTAEAFAAPLALIWLDGNGRSLFAAHPRPRGDASLRSGAGGWASLRARLADAAGEAPLHVEDAHSHVFLRDNPLVAASVVRACAAVSLPGTDGRSRGMVALAGSAPASIPRAALDALVFWAHRLATELPGDDLPSRARPPSPSPRHGRAPDLAGALGVGAIVSDDRGQVTFANAAAAELLAIGTAKLSGMRREALLSLLVERSGADVDSIGKIAEAAKAKEPRSFSLLLRRRTLRWETRVVRHEGREGTLDEIVDVTPEAERLQANDDYVRIDAETGLSNRRAAEEALGREIAAALRGGTPFSVILFEIGGAAPASFRAIAWLLRDALRGYDLAVRFADRKLLAVLPGARAAQAKALAERFSAKVRAAVKGASLACGVAQFDGESDVQRLLSAAESALAALPAARRPGGAR